MLVAVARQKLWDRERATPQPTSGSVTHEKKTNTSNGQRLQQLFQTRSNGRFLFLKKSRFVVEILCPQLSTKTCQENVKGTLHRHG